MPDKKDVAKKSPEQVMFDPALLQKIEETVNSLPRSVPVVDKGARKLWFKDKIAKGFTLQEIMQKVKETNYDFTAAATYLDNTYAARMKSEKAYKEVTAMKDEADKKKETEKLSARLSWIVTAFSIAAVSAFSSWMIRRTVGDSGPELTSIAMPGGDILGNFMKGGWILAGASAGVGLLLLAFFLTERFITRTKNETQEEEVLGLKKEEQKVLQEAQKKEIEEELAKKVQ